jgi:16S rRNA processing protein RimM
MAYKKQILIGRITKIHGNEGAVTVKLERTLSGNIPAMEWVFLEIEGIPVPFLISQQEDTGAGKINLMFDGYESIEKVSEFTGCRVFLSEGTDDELLPEDLASISGFSVVTAEKELIGFIKEVIRNPGQWLLTIVTDDKREILIPLHEDFIIEVDQERKSIIMDLPEGLTDIN